MDSACSSKFVSDPGVRAFTLFLSEGEDDQEQQTHSPFCRGAISISSRCRSDPDQFARFFNHCLDAGVYFAPSQFETGFICTAHQPAQIEETARIVREALQQISR